MIVYVSYYTVNKPRQGPRVTNFHSYDVEEITFSQCINIRFKSQASWYLTIFHESQVEKSKFCQVLLCTRRKKTDRTSVYTKVVIPHGFVSVLYTISYVERRHYYYTHTCVMNNRHYLFVVCGYNTIVIRAVHYHFSCRNDIYVVSLHPICVQHNVVCVLQTIRLQRDLSIIAVSILLPNHL